MPMSTRNWCVRGSDAAVFLPIGPTVTVAAPACRSACQSQASDLVAVSEGLGKATKDLKRESQKLVFHLSTINFTCATNRPATQGAEWIRIAANNMPNFCCKAG